MNKLLYDTVLDAMFKAAKVMDELSDGGERFNEEQLEAALAFNEALCLLEQVGEE